MSILFIMKPVGTIPLFVMAPGASDLVAGFPKSEFCLALALIQLALYDK